MKLSAEVSDLSEPMREALKQGAASVVALIANTIERGIKDGSIANCDSHVTAQILYNLWLGASLLNKLSHDLSGLQQALTTTQSLLQPK